MQCGTQLTDSSIKATRKEPVISHTRGGKKGGGGGGGDKGGTAPFLK